MNRVILSGRLTRDPEIRYSQGENPTAIARYTLAVERRYKRQSEENNADFINCVAFGKSAEVAEKYFRKGIKVIVEGSWQTGSYTNKDGVKVYTNECIVQSQEFCESKNAGQDAQGEGQGQYEGSGEVYEGDDGFMNIPDGIDEELPFN